MNQRNNNRIKNVETGLGSILAGTLDELATNRWRRDFAQRTTDCCFLGFFSFIDSLDYMVGWATSTSHTPGFSCAIPQPRNVAAISGQASPRTHALHEGNAHDADDAVLTARHTKNRNMQRNRLCFNK